MLTTAGLTRSYTLLTSTAAAWLATGGLPLVDCDGWLVGWAREPIAGSTGTAGLPAGLARVYAINATAPMMTPTTTADVGLRTIPIRTLLRVCPLPDCRDEGTATG